MGILKKMPNLYFLSEVLAISAGIGLPEVSAQCTKKGVVDRKCSAKAQGNSKSTHFSKRCLLGHSPPQTGQTWQLTNRLNSSKTEKASESVIFSGGHYQDWKLVCPDWTIAFLEALYLLV